MTGGAGWEMSCPQPVWTTTGAGFLRPDSTVLLDWAAVARKLGKVPSAREYVRTGQYHHLTFIGRFKYWSNVPQAFAKFARGSRMEQDWKDVLELVARHTAAKQNPVRKGRFSRSMKSTVLPGLPIYGPPMALPEMAHEPVNEAGVIFAFGVLAARLRFCVHGCRRSSRIAKPCARWREASGRRSGWNSNLRAAIF